MQFVKVFAVFPQDDAQIHLCKIRAITALFGGAVESGVEKSRDQAFGVDHEYTITAKGWLRKELYNSLFWV